jgi:hypothetical protein
MWQSCLWWEVPSEALHVLVNDVVRWELQRDVSLEMHEGCDCRADRPRMQLCDTKRTETVLNAQLPLHWRARGATVPVVLGREECVKLLQQLPDSCGLRFFDEAVFQTCGESVLERGGVLAQNFLS